MKITELFQNREFVVSAEVGPPKGIHIDGMVEEAKKYLTGVHFVKNHGLTTARLRQINL